MNQRAETEQDSKQWPALIVIDPKYERTIDWLKRSLKVSPDRFKQTQIVDSETAQKRQQSGDVFGIVIVVACGDNWEEDVKRFCQDSFVYVVSPLSSVNRTMAAFNCGAKDYGHDPSKFFWRHENPPEG